MGCDMKNTPYWLFNIAYLLFLLPVIYSLIQELASGDKATPVLSISVGPLESLVSAAIWLPFMLLCYLCQRWALARLGWKQGAKPARQQKDDFVRMSYINVGLLFLARISKRIVQSRATATEQCWGGSKVCLGFYEIGFLFLVFYYAAFFSVLFEMVRFIDLTISIHVFSKPKGLWIVVVGAVVVVAVLRAHAVYAFSQGDEFGWAYLGWIGLMFAAHAIAIAVTPAAFRRIDARQHESGSSRQDDDSVKLHVHHWYWTFFAAHFPVFDTTLSYVAQALFLGVYIHGVGCFGLEPIFEPDHKDLARVHHREDEMTEEIS